MFVSEDAPEFARELPEEEWNAERDPDRIAQMLNDYDHPILLLQQMIWHEGYHHGQIKLALKLAGRAMTNEEAGPVTWGVWMRKNVL